MEIYEATWWRCNLCEFWISYQFLISMLIIRGCDHSWLRSLDAVGTCPGQNRLTCVLVWMLLTVIILYRYHLKTRHHELNEKSKHFSYPDYFTYPVCQHQGCGQRGLDNRSSTVVARCSLCTPIKVLQLLWHCIVTSYRHPNKNLRPSFSNLHTSLSDHTLSLGMKESQVEAEGSDQPLLHPQAHNIGASLEAGKELYDDLQNIYINEWHKLSVHVLNFKK